MPKIDLNKLCTRCGTVSDEFTHCLRCGWYYCDVCWAYHDSDKCFHTWTLNRPRKVDVKVCVRDGELPATIEVAGVTFHMGAGDLLDVITAAQVNLRDAPPALTRVFDHGLKAIEEVCRKTCSLAPRASDEDTAKNFNRWGETGVGGKRDTVEFLAELAAFHDLTRYDFAGEREAFIDRGCILFSDGSAHT